MVELSSSGYPEPDGSKTYDQMLPQYTYALGGSARIAELKAWLDEQESVVAHLNQKQVKKDPAV